MPIRHAQSNKLRRGRVDADSPTLITCCCIDRLPLLHSEQAATEALQSLLWLDQIKRIELHVAVVMPDHVHFVATLLGGSWAKLMHSFKGFTAHRINLLLARHGALWQPQYQDRGLRCAQDLESAIRYCLNNPLRRGYVLDYHDYAHWYARYEI